MNNFSYLALQVGGVAQALFGPVGFGLIVGGIIALIAVLFAYLGKREQDPTKAELAYEEYRKQVWTELCQVWVDQEIARRAAAAPIFSPAPVAHTAPTHRPETALAVDLNPSI